jgi:hypothetical protein
MLALVRMRKCVSLDARRISPDNVAPNGCTSILSHIFWTFIERANFATLPPD